MRSRVLPSTLRRLIRSPRLSLAAIVCIAIGSAATTAALTLVSATLLRDLPFPAAERLVRIWIASEGGEARGAVSYPDLTDLSAALLPADGGSPPVLEALEATARARLQFRSGSGARRVEGEAVTAGYFQLLGVTPILGRGFAAEDHLGGGRPVMLLDHGAWVERFARDESVVGSSVKTDRGEFTVVGVLPDSFTGSVEDDSGELEFWVPIEAYLSPAARQDRSIDNIWTIGRLPADGSHAALGSRLEALGRRIAEIHPGSFGGRRFVFEALGENWREQVREGSWLLVAAAALLLLVASANVAVLFVAKAVANRHELAVRGALGARRRQLVVEALLEPIVLVVAGCALGLLAGPPLLRLFAGRNSLTEAELFGIPSFVRLGIDPVSAALSGLAFLVTAIVAALIPALLASRADPVQALEAGGRGAIGSGRGGRWSSALIVGEVALTLLLLFGSTLLARSYRSLTTQDLGFRSDGVLRLALFVHPQEVEERAALWPFYERLRDELASVAGVERVGVVWPTVPMDWPVREVLAVDGMAPPDPARPESGLDVGLFVADADFFEVTRIPLLAGRRFDDRDGPEAPRAALVSEALARRIAAGLGGSGELDRVVDREAVLSVDERTPIRIVGVVGDTRFGGPREADSPLHRQKVYLSLRQSPRRLFSFTVATVGDPALLAPSLERRLGRLAPLSATDWIGPFDRLLAELYLADTQFLLAVVGSFSLAALVLAAVGLFALLSDAVARRRSEIGLRQALGATRRRLIWSLLTDGLRLTALGLAIGALLAAALGRLLRSHVYGVATSDPGSFVVSAVVLLAVALIAGWIPARAAARVDPSQVLREG